MRSCDRTSSSAEARSTMAKHICSISSEPPATLAVGKEAFYQQAEMSLADAYDYTAGVMVENMMHKEAKEGIAAFVEKRPPDWTKP
jgi:enoyl-CoA hydratase/carnithine racemase